PAPASPPRCHPCCRPPPPIPGSSNDRLRAPCHILWGPDCSWGSTPGGWKRERATASRLGILEASVGQHGLARDFPLHRRRGLDVELMGKILFQLHEQGGAIRGWFKAPTQPHLVSHWQRRL